MNDPAVLWYWNDWGGGTRILTRHLKGCYIDLLEAQFNSGRLTLEEIRTVLGQDQAAWTVLSKKFKQDENGLFYNERLDSEIKKRKAYSESRRANKIGKKKEVVDDIKNICFSHDKRMENENENENTNDITIISKGGVGEKNKKKEPKEKPAWETDFSVYKKELDDACRKIITPDYIKEREKYHPNLDIRLTLEKAYKDYWSREAGWIKKKSAKISTINWESTFNNALTQKMNQVYKEQLSVKTPY